MLWLGDKKRVAGRYGEWLAARYLNRRGYRIIKKNYKNRAGEIDIIAMDGEYTVFVEVKTRRNETFGRAVEAVDYRKRRKIIETVMLFLRDAPIPHSVRFDVIGINIRGLRNRIEHIESAFELET